MDGRTNRKLTKLKTSFLQPWLSLAQKYVKKKKKKEHGRESSTYLTEGRRWRQSGRDRLGCSTIHESNQFCYPVKKPLCICVWEQAEQQKKCVLVSVSFLKSVGLRAKLQDWICFCIHGKTKTLYCKKSSICFKLIKHKVYSFFSVLKFRSDSINFFWL